MEVSLVESPFSKYCSVLSLHQFRFTSLTSWVLIIGGDCKFTHLLTAHNRFCIFRSKLFGSFDAHFFLVTAALSTAILSILPYCYVGSMTTEQLLDIANIVYSSHWYKAPVERQKYLQLIIHNAQIERKISGYGLIACNLRTFVEVFIQMREVLQVVLFELRFHFQALRATFSYFVMFKRLS